nr:hypothetical protein Iba_chr11cCG8640 [Ipomoea batatas]
MAPPQAGFVSSTLSCLGFAGGKIHMLNGQTDQMMLSASRLPIAESGKEAYLLSHKSKKNNYLTSCFEWI